MERAIFGEQDAGLAGLVNDMRDMKNFRDRQLLQAAGIAGAVTALMLGTKALLTKLFS